MQLQPINEANLHYNTNHFNTFTLGSLSYIPGDGLSASPMKASIIRSDRCSSVSVSHSLSEVLLAAMASELASIHAEKAASILLSKEDSQPHVADVRSGSVSLKGGYR